MISQAIVLAGGFGTRLQPVLKDIPKPMAPVSGKPFLEYLLMHLKKSGIKKVILSSGYKSEAIEKYFGKHFSGMDIEYSIETEPLGTGGAVKKAVELCTDTSVLVLNGDSFFNVDISTFEKFHNRKKSSITVAVKSMNDSSRYGCVITDTDNRVTGFTEKKPGAGIGLINGGIYLINIAEIPFKNLPEKFSFEKDVLEKSVDSLALFACESDGYFIDIGIPDDYERAQKESDRFSF